MNRSNINLENEIETLKSYPLLERVVTRLELCAQFFEKGRVKSKPIVKLPFDFKLTRPLDSIVDSNQFFISVDELGFELQSANYADGTELDEKELEDLESTQELIDWVMIDFVSEDAVSEDNQLEGLTFEDIKPYVSMYKDKDGKIVNAVLDKDGAEVFKTHDGKAAMAYLSQNYDKLKKEDNAPDMVIRDPDDEAEDKEQEIAKDQADAEKINTELDRIKTLASP